MTCKIKVSPNHVALVDDADEGVVSKFRWLLNRDGYAISGSSEKVFMHRLILGLSPGEITDHIDGNPLNNKRQNLRTCTHGENMRNRKIHRNNASGFKGVYKDTSGRDAKQWRAEVCHEGKRYRVGRFKTPEEAHEAYKKKAKELHGDFFRHHEITRTK